MMRKLLELTNIGYIGIVFTIFVCGLLIRVIWLGQIPAGLTNDEANVGYDAYSILLTGKDQWGVKQPSTNLKGFGDYRPPIYTYAVVPSVKIFGLNEFSVRLPSAIFGSLTLIILFFLTKNLLKNKFLALLSMMFLAVNPWHIAMSRVGIESTMGVFIFSTAILFFLLGIKNKFYIFIAIIFATLTLLTYTSYLLFTPLIFFVLFIIFRKELSTNKKQLAAMILVILLCIAPIIGNKDFNTARARSKQVNLTNDTGVIDLTNSKRGGCQIDLNSRICQIFQNKYSAFLIVFLNNYFNHFSPDLFINKGTTTQYSVMYERGLFYIYEYLLLIIGIIFIFRKQNKSGIVLISWLLLAPIPDSLTSNGHYSRFLIVLPVIQIISAFGFYQLLCLLNKFKMLALGILPVILFEVMMFNTLYWSYFPLHFSPYNHYGYHDLIRFINDHKHEYSKVIVSSSVNDTKQYIYYLFYSKYNPKIYQSGSDIEKINEANGWIRINRIENIYFANSLSFEAQVQKVPTEKILQVGSPKEFPQKSISIYEVKDLQNKVLFSLVESRL